MDLGSEISQKFKASIKRKLKDSGTYIDDELPEYIMVMIANKRQQYQMKDDLSLFLGEETDDFVAWLFQMLDKLQSATQDEPMEDNQPKTLAKQSIMDLQIEPKSIETEAVVIKSEPQDSEIEQPENEKIENVEQTMVAEEYLNRRNYQGSVEKLPEIEQRRDSGDKGTQRVEKDITKFDKIISKEEEEKVKEDYRRKHRKRQKSPSPSNITIVVPEEDKRHERIEKKKAKVRKLSTSPSRRKEKVEYSDEEEETMMEPPKQLSSKVTTIQKIRPSLPRSRQATGLLIQRAIKEANQSVTTIPRKRSESQEQIEAAHSRLETSTERRVQLKRSKAKHPIDAAATSTAFEKEARESGDEAQESAAVGKRRKVGDQDDGIEVEVPDNEFQEEETEANRRLDRRTVILNRTYARKKETESEAKGNNKAKRKEEEKQIVHEDFQVKQVENDAEEQKEQIVNSEDHKENSKLKDDKDEKHRRERRKRRSRREKSNHREKRRNSPQFVVTLHGESHEQAKDKRQRRYHSSRRAHSSSEDDSIFIDLNPKKPMEILESAQKEINKMALKLDFMQNVLPPSNIDPINSFLTNSSISLPPLSGTITSMTTPVFQETLPIIPGELNTRILSNSIYNRQHTIAGVLPVPSPVIVMQNVPEQRRSPRARSSSREVIVSIGSEAKEDVNEDQDIIEDEEEESDTFLMRCKFWPNCRNEGCSYVHPTKPCRMFPNCNFKDKCIFLHPMCKFDKRCSNPACTYTHTSKQRVPMPFAPKARVKHELFIDPTTPICKFIPNCSRTNCHFRHPVTKPCRFGSGCKRSDCPFHHETRPASGGALKWSNNSNSPKHISERTFAASVEEVTIIPISVTTR